MVSKPASPPPSPLDEAVRKVLERNRPPAYARTAGAAYAILRMSAILVVWLGLGRILWLLPTWVELALQMWAGG